MTTKPTINMKSVNVWIGYEFDQECCQICRLSLQAPPLSELNNNEKSCIDMTVTVGNCDHIFHKICINELAKNGSVSSCPVCNLVWKEKANLRSEISISS